MSNFSLCKFKDEKLMTLCSNIPRMSPICQIPIWRIRFFCATHTTQSNWVPVFLLLFCKKKKKGYPIWWESWSRGLINWAQTLLCKFISSHKHFVFNKTNCVFSLFVMMFFHLISSLKVLPASGPYVLPWLHMGRIWRKRKKEEVIILRVKSQ